MCVIQDGIQLHRAQSQTEVIQIEAGYAGVIRCRCGRPLRVAARTTARAAEHAAVADRFAREIVCILTDIPALAAAKRQPVRPAHIIAVPYTNLFFLLYSN